MGKLTLPKILLNLFDTSSEGLWTMSAGNVIRFYNYTFYQQFNISLERADLNDWLVLVHPEDRADWTQTLDALQQGQVYDQVRARYRVKNGSGRYIWVEVTAVKVEDGDGFAIVGSHKDVSEEILLNRYLKHMANHDSETGLLKCHQFLRHAPTLIEGGWVFVCSLVHFQQFQRKIGNIAARQLSSTLVSMLDEVLFFEYDLYRISADIFVVTAEKNLSIDRIITLMDEMESFFQKKGQAGNQSLTSKLGIGAMPVNNLNFENPLEKIFNLSEYTRLVQSPITYTGKHRQHIDRHFEIQDSLEAAIENRQISIALQPIIETSTGDLLSFEVLSRWEHSKLGWISPDEFIPMAEQLGYIHTLGMVVLTQACEYLVMFDAINKARPLINVNISAHQLLNPCFVDDVLAVVNKFEVSPGRVVLEITESYLLDKDSGISNGLRLLNSLGFKLSIDDFGAGMSAITSLFRLPLYQIKLDKGLVNDAMKADACVNFVAHLCDFGQTHRIVIVAEGVESSEMFDKLKEIGVPYLQGHFLYKPCAPHQWLKNSAVV